MLYKQNKTDKLSGELFKNPTSEYRGAPFWAWNCKLDRETLTEQIEYLKEMGFGGFHMHSRSGMATEYLSGDFFDLVKTCVDKAKEEKMLAWLYDEDRWPSGAAGGYVTKNVKYRKKYIQLTTEPIEDASDKEIALEKGLSYLLTCYDIVQNEKGELLSYNMIGEKDKASGRKWYLYVSYEKERGWHNGQTYLDTLCPEAVDEFIRITHEAYKRNTGKNFGETIPAIFTDEPNFPTFCIFKLSTDTEKTSAAWTTDLDRIFEEKYGYSLFEHLPEIFWELPDRKPSKTRYRYIDLVCELFTSSFMDKIGKWCENNEIKFTGHVLAEENLQSQSSTMGEAMRNYRCMGLPGIDMLCNNIELSTAKQAQSVVHQYAREGMLSELYGVTNWDFDFRGHKFQGDWQAALGVTVRVPHLSWVSMKGSAKRDYPASINYQSPWYREYPYIEDHFARLNTALTRGKPTVNVGVIHPVESFWLRFGPNDLTGDMQADLQKKFDNIINWLLFGMIDFDFISEALLADIGSCGDDKLTVGAMSYSSIIVPGCETLRRSTFELLKKFKENGGKLIFCGECPKYIDAEETDEINELYINSEVVDWSKPAVLNALEEDRFIKITGGTGIPTENLIYTLRQDNDVKWLFITHAKKEDCDNFKAENITVTLNGEYIPKLYDTTTGDTKDINCCYRDGKTVIKKVIYPLDSMLFMLEEGRKGANETEIKAEDVPCTYLSGMADYRLDEPNVYMLDMAEYKLDDGEYMPEDEVLRIDKKSRIPLGFPMADGHDSQPWAIEEEKISHFITLKFTIESEIAVSGIFLAAEEAEEIEFNGENAGTVPCGYYVDKAIKKFRLPDIKKGTNILTVKVPFGKRASIEACYLLGNFGVSVCGRSKKITALPDKLGYGSITTQGLPFYGGNITYITEINLDKPANTELFVSRYRGALVRVKVDGKDAGRIVYPPYGLNLAKLSAGNHSLEITCFGNRVNTFGSLHNNNYSDKWFGPGHWYSDDQNGWCYEYVLRDTGILSSPVIKIRN